MFDWDTDSFMSAWDKKYVSTNVKAEARPYDRDLFLGLNSKLATSQPELRSYSHAIIVSADLQTTTIRPYTHEITNCRVQ